MTEYDYWKIFPKMPKKAYIGDITVRDGFQHEEKFISTATKIFYAEEMILAGAKEIEVTNLGSPKGIPQFRDAEQVLTALRSDEFKKRCARKGVNYDDVVMTAVTIRESAVDTAIELRKRGIGPDRLLMMVSTDPEHHFANSGTTLTQYWKEAERCIRKAADVGMKMCGTVSTIWGSPITGATRLEDAVEFTKRFLSIGAYDIEHADHDGSASAAQVYRYFSMVLDALGTLGGLGGQPTNFLDDCPVRGTGDYYYDPRYVGLITMEDLVVMIDELGIEHGYDVNRVLWLGAKMEKTIGRRLRSEAVINGRTLKEGHPQYARPGLAKLIEKLGEKHGQLVPPEWPAATILPEKYGPGGWKMRS
jgi:hydroxymethylglutaryl-CoA lyase